MLSYLTDLELSNCGGNIEADVTSLLACSRSKGKIIIHVYVYMDCEARVLTSRAQIMLVCINTWLSKHDMANNCNSRF